jgi:hypothetical protein
MAGFNHCIMLQAGIYHLNAGRLFRGLKDSKGRMTKVRKGRVLKDGQWLSLGKNKKNAPCSGVFQVPEGMTLVILTQQGCELQLTPSIYAAFTNQKANVS